MFSTTNFDPIGFPSSSSSTKESAEASVQANFPIHDKEVQALSSSSAEVQTETEEIVKTHATAEFDLEKLHSFLTKVTPGVIKELDKIEKSKAFTLHKTARDESSEEVKELFKLRSKSKEENFVVTKLAWSCTGNVIAVGLGAKSHQEWCSHESAVHFYNINKHNFDGSLPTRVVRTESCVTTIACHPYEPAIVAVGTYNGEIFIWNLQKEGDVSFENSIFHDDKVTQMLWVRVNSQMHLFTSSLDGSIFAFKVSPGLGSTVLADRYTFNDNPDRPKPGITCFAFSFGQRGVFVTGVEGGGLVQCSIVAASEITLDGNSQVYKDPTVQLLPTQSAPVICISFSPFVDHLFCTATAEQKFVVHSLKEAAPLHELWTDFEITGVEWSPSQENAVIAWGKSPQVRVYDPNSGKHLQTLQSERYGNRGHPIVVAAYNSKSPKLLAVGSDKDEDACIWEVPRYFTAK